MANNLFPTKLFHKNHLNRLLLDGVQGGRMVLYLVKIDTFQVDAAQIAVIHGAVIDAAIVRIRCHGKLGGAGYIGRCFSPRLFGACRNVEVVQQVESLEDTFFGRRLLGSGELEESGPYET